MSLRTHVQRWWNNFLKNIQYCLGWMIGSVVNALGWFEHYMTDCSGMLRDEIKGAVLPMHKLFRFFSFVITHHTFWIIEKLCNFKSGHLFLRSDVVESSEILRSGTANSCQDMIKWGTLEGHKTHKVQIPLVTMECWFLWTSRSVKWRSLEGHKTHKSQTVHVDGGWSIHVLNSAC